ncbi:MAG: DUF3854 domain-containing protein [Chloroflexi bacterium]|nr:DUF3854 domain-containing protein [Chloroflexota bacterium]
MLGARGVSPEVALARGCHSYDALEAKERKYAAKGSGLYIPRWRVDGRQDGFQFRPDSPRLKADGSPIKYESPAGQRNILDVNPLMRERLKAANEGAFITEGAFKADALASIGVPAINLAGVYGWRGRNPQGGSTVLPDWEELNLRGATWVLAFDSDILTKPAVHEALSRLKAWLEWRGAKRVGVLVLPQLGDGKTGVDDYLAALQRGRP